MVIQLAINWHNFFEGCAMPSTVIASALYNAQTSSLRITFTSGLVYEYKKVPLKIYEEMMAYRAKGIYLNRYIKGKFDFEKIETP